MSINAEGTLIIGNEDCLRKVFDLYQTDAGEIVTILERHFLIDLILDSEFIERCLSKTDQPQGFHNLKSPGNAKYVPACHSHITNERRELSQCWR